MRGEEALRLPRALSHLRRSPGPPEAMISDVSPKQPGAGSGSGSSLPASLLYVCLSATLFSVVVSLWSIALHLKGFRRPNLQRLVVRIMVCVPALLQLRHWPRADRSALAPGREA